MQRGLAVLGAKEFELQPTLVGDGIELWPLKPGDFEALYAAASDPLIWEQHPHRDRYQREVFEKFFQGALDSKGAFVVIESESRRVIGSTRFYDLDLEKREIVLGYTFLVRDHWGGKTNQEMKRLALEHAFRFVDHVLFCVDSKNLRSQKAMQKIGAEHFKTVQEPWPPHGIREVMIFRMTQECLSHLPKPLGVQGGDKENI